MMMIGFTNMYLLYCRDKGYSANTTTIKKEGSFKRGSIHHIIA